MAAVEHPNQLLGSLAAADFALLSPHLKPVELVHGTVLFEAGDTVTQAYFPHSGIISLVIALTGGEAIEVAMTGRDGIVGAAAALDGDVAALNKGIVQVEGTASTVSVGHLRMAAERVSGFRTALVRHEHALMAQVQQSAACNAAHTVEARMARWLLRSLDLSGANTLSLTQEFMAQMLGVRRTSVSLVANTLKHAGLIRYSRGRIEVRDLEGLRGVSCECYATVKGHYDRLRTNPVAQ